MNARFQLCWLVGVATATVAGAADSLPEGVVAAPSAVTAVGRALLACWGVALLAVGRRRPHLVIGTLSLAVGLVVGLVTLAATSYALSIGMALLALTLGLGVHAVAPRVALALAACWWPAAIYLANVFMSGGMSRSTVLTVALLVIGAALGAVFPDTMVGVLAAALGTAMVAVAWPGQVAFWPLLAVFVVATLWQLVLPRVVRPPLLERRPATSREKQRAALRSARSAALGTIAVVSLLLVMTPVPSPIDAVHQTRVDALREATRGRPGLLLSPASSLYLFGVAHPVAVAGSASSLGGRLAVMANGRSCSRELAKLRAVKTPEELETMRRAAAITASAFRAVTPLVRPGANESELEAAILAAFKQGGATGVAFKPIVGSGANAVLPHYQDNDDVLRDGLVVIDIGCTLDGYASDITRTFPVSGAWTPEQRRLLDVVLEAKEEARAALVPGASLRALNRTAHGTIRRAGFGGYFSHGLSHHVGIEVHDAHVDALEDGMVVTIEPGIYIPAGSDIEPSYWNLGIRVEDTYLVTPHGGVPLADLPEVLPAGEQAAASS